MPIATWGSITPSIADILQFIANIGYFVLKLGSIQELYGPFY